MKNIAIIPARCGSKGLVDKNIMLMNGKPLIAYSIESAIKSGLFATVFVSTDSEKYANIAREYGAEVPFLRSKKTSDDRASSWDTVREVISNYSDIGSTFDSFMLLQPTSPLRDSDDIQMAYSNFKEKNANAIISVCEVDHSPLWTNTLPDDLALKGFIAKSAIGLRRQDLPKYYRINGAIYLIRTSFFMSTDDIYSDSSFAFIMDKRKSVDIDDIIDFKLAEAIMNIK